jgi:hypothetical protein
MFFTFKKVLFSIDGPLEVRLHNLMNILDICEVFKFDFRIIWRKKTPKFDIDLSDIFITEIFKGKLLTNIDEIKRSNNYFYNPKHDIQMILSTTIPYHLSSNIPDIKNYEWLVIDNLHSKKCDMMPRKYISNNSLKLERLRNNYNKMKLNSNIEGYVNIFKQVQKEKQLIGIYINDNTNIDSYIDTIKRLPAHLNFFAVYNIDNFSESQIKLFEVSLTKEFSDRITLVKLTESGKYCLQAINLFCLSLCPTIMILNSMADGYIEEVCRIGEKINIFKLDNINGKI